MRIVQFRTIHITSILLEDKMVKIHISNAKIAIWKKSMEKIVLIFGVSEDNFWGRGGGEDFAIVFRRQNMSTIFLLRSLKFDHRIIGKTT